MDERETRKARAVNFLENLLEKIKRNGVEILEIHFTRETLEIPDSDTGIIVHHPTGIETVTIKHKTDL